MTDGSAVPGVVVAPSVAEVAADAFPGAAFGVTGTAAATALVNAAALAGVALACVACWITGAATAPPAAAEIAVFAVAVPAVAVLAVVFPAAASAAAVVESVLIWADEAACAETACVLAAIAAAAIASGAVGLPDVVAAAGTFVEAVVTGIATATGFGVVAVSAACWARMVRSVADVSPPADLSVDFAGSVFGAPVDFAWDGWDAPELVGPLVLALLALRSEGGPALALSFGLLLAA